jgi:hypothetical protein
MDTARTKQISEDLRDAGLTESDINRFRGGKKPKRSAGVMAAYARMAKKAQRGRRFFEQAQGEYESSTIK